MWFIVGSDAFSEFNKWEKYDLVASGTTGNYTVILYKNGVAANAGEASDANVTGISAPFKIGYFMQTNHANFSGFMDDFQIYKGVAFNANTIIERYQTGRAGNYTTANSSCVLHVKADSTYGNETFIDSSYKGHKVYKNYKMSHYIDDNRTANTALFFDGYSMIKIHSNSLFQPGKSDFTAEAWVKLNGARQPATSYMKIMDKWQDGGGASREVEFRIDGELIKMSEVVKPIFIDGVWFEIDTIEDLANIRKKIAD